MKILSRLFGRQPTTPASLAQPPRIATVGYKPKLNPLDDILSGYAQGTSSFYGLGSDLPEIPTALFERGLIMCRLAEKWEPGSEVLENVFGQLERSELFLSATRDFFIGLREVEIEEPDGRLEGQRYHLSHYASRLVMAGFLAGIEHQKTDGAR